ncbi:MAG: ATP-binding protein [Clostridiales bacterium]|jgi:anti-sigma regulatory factor (Ser/Thr protein kinase)|nr:ATP-binding protein [Clostridiales bacterium]
MMKELSMNIMDIAQNSVRAEADFIEITIEENTEEDLLSFTIADNGRGMSAEFLRNVSDPFHTSRTTRRVGLGIPLVRQTCESCGGELSINSAPGAGTTLTASMKYSHIDRPPWGDLAEAVFLTILMNPGIRFRYKHTFNGETYELDTLEVSEALDGAPLDAPDVSRWLKDNIKEGIREIREES